jgi:hypothetical protein
VLQKIHLAETGGDKAAQIFATKNLLAGHGVSTYEVAASNLADPHYIPLIKWPPGYSYLLAPFYEASGEHFLWGSLFPDLLAAIFFVWFARKIILLLDAPVPLANLYTIVAGFFMYEFCASNSSDLITATLFEIALYLSLRFAVSAKKSWGSTLLIVLLLFSAGFIRYLMIPVALVIPAYFIFYGFFSRERKMVSRAVVMILLLSVLNVFFLWTQQSQAGNAVYILESEKGFYPENLLRLSVFLFSSFLNPEFICVQLSRATGLSYMTIAMPLVYAHLLCVLLILFPAIKWIRSKRLRNFTLLDHYIYLGIFCSLATILVLAFLSCRNAAAPIGVFGDWTFIAEGRYFFIPVLFVQLLVLLTWWKKRSAAGSWLLRLARICLIALCLQTLHAIYYTAKIPFGQSVYKKTREFETLAYYKALLKKIKNDNPGKKLVAASFDDSYAHYAGLWEQLPELRPALRMNDMALSTTQATIIIFTLHQRDEPEFTGFLNNPAKQLQGQINDHRFYTIHVSPAGKK